MKSGAPLTAFYCSWIVNLCEPPASVGIRVFPEEH